MYKQSMPTEPTILSYAQPQRFSKVRRWLGPKSPLFWLVIFAIATGIGWKTWKRQLQQDEEAFNAVAEMRNPFLGSPGKCVRFMQPPTAAALRHMARIPGTFGIELRWGHERTVARVDNDLPLPSPIQGNPSVFITANLSNVTTILMYGEINGDEWIKKIALNTGPKNFSELLLIDDSVTDSALLALANPRSGLSKVTSFGCISEKLTEKGYIALANPDSGMNSIRYFSTMNYWSHWQNSDAVICAFAQPNSALKHLEGLKLNHKMISDDGVFALASPNSGMQSLLDLELDQSNLTQHSFDEIARPDSVLKSLRHLRLQSASEFVDGPVAFARPDSSLSKLEDLDIRDCKLTADGFKRIAAPDTGLKSLQKLYVYVNGFDDIAAEALSDLNSGLKNIQLLDLKNNNFSDGCLAKLSRPDTALQNLTSLQLEKNDEITDAGLIAIARPDTGIAKLQYLTLSSPGITDKGLRALFDANSGLKALKEIRLEGAAYKYNDLIHTLMWDKEKAGRR